MNTVATGAAAAAGTAAAAYWTTMSSYSQVLGPFPYRSVRGDHRIALTFDDGPNEPYTSQIADVLGDFSAPATFFQVGRCVERHPGVTRRLAAAGHVIGNHSHRHQFHRCFRAGHLRADVAATQRILRGELGRVPALYRPPWLLRTPALFDTLGTHGLTAVSGEFCHAAEFVQPPAEWIARRALAKVRPGGILIFHDGFDGRGGNRAQTVAAVRIVVAELARRGYEFTTVDRLLDVPAYGPAVGAGSRVGV